MKKILFVFWMAQLFPLLSFCQDTVIYNQLSHIYLEEGAVVHVEGSIYNAPGSALHHATISLIDGSEFQLDQI